MTRFRLASLPLKTSSLVPLLKIDAIEKRFDWENALIDATIISAVTFFSTLGGGAVAGINSAHTIQAAAVAAFSQFFVFLALKRGLVQNKETKLDE